MTFRVNQVASRGGFKLEGAAELRAALEELGNEVATKVGRRANRLAAVEMRDVMVSTAPESKADKSPGSKKFGSLKTNIKVRLAKARRENVIVYNVTVGRAFWGFFQEFGTRNQPAYPWMRPAFDATVRLAIDTQTGELRTGIERAAKKARKLNGAR
jgi:HK97 gp10 family phage protein